MTIYQTLDGKRRLLKSLDVKVTANEWHTLRTEFKDKLFRILFDGKEFTAEDGSISGAGLVGLWTKADSVTLL